MSAPINAEQPRHIHYCKDYLDKTGSICFDRGYCECDCGARAALSSDSFNQILWMTAAEWDAKEATT